MFGTIRNHLKKDDNAVSAVIGTILMIAVTVILGGVIYAAIGGFGSKDLAPKADYGFAAKAVDTNNDGVNDAIKISYVSGASGISPTLSVKALSATGTDGNTSTCFGANPSATPAVAASASPGDTCIVRSLSGSYSVTIAVAKSTVLDTTVTVS